MLILHQGLNWVGAMQRGLERTFGTILGLMFAAVLLWLHPHGLALVGCIALLQFAGQMFAASNYTFAVFFFTPMALLMATAVGRSASDVSQLLVARGLDTMIGCGVGLAVLLATYRTHGATVRNALSETLGAAKSVLPFLARGEVTTAEARIARRRLRSNAFDLVQIYEEQAGGTERAREEADRTWPAIVAAHRLAFRILAECWEIEAEGNAGNARGPLLFGASGEHATVRALNSLQAGHAAEIPRSASSFLLPEITALNESLPS
ncbi:FUSC family protein [Bradyrhizobium sp. Ash2021]|uniref:FUSC family protein n=1 Tax=Bradyrhizobium sp. Ash2021 TaxID=2954771 RepID=UPI002814C143|nr:FUSC family protein [Bradyrhizobium sp. Ash2021]WMT74490.1 FUSC family protein [Bradyrhizobium sp. Ash2021]